MDQIELAIARFKEGFNCAQALLSTYGAAFGLDVRMALKIAAPFGGGMGHTGEICGAVSGALMVVGLRTGSTTARDSRAKAETDRMAKAFLNRFRARHGSIVCRELLGYDMSQEEGMKMLREKKLISTACPQFVRDAAEILADLLKEHDSI